MKKIEAQLLICIILGFSGFILILLTPQPEMSCMTSNINIWHTAQSLTGAALIIAAMFGFTILIN